ncbi:MAG: hypothetical protein WD425_08130 [Nitrospirales bacterium]
MDSLASRILWNSVALLGFLASGLLPIPVHAAPGITSPAPGSTLTTSTVTFTGGHAVRGEQHWVYVGSTPGGKDYYFGKLNESHRFTVTGLPSNGTIYVQYLTRTRKKSAWQTQTHAYRMLVNGKPAPPQQQPTTPITPSLLPRIQPLPLDGQWRVFVSSPEKDGPWNTMWTFTLSAHAELTIVDLVTGGDRYQVFNGDTFLGETSPGHFKNTGGPVEAFITLNPNLALPDPDFGHITIRLAPGFYRIAGRTSLVGGPGANRAAIRLVTGFPRKP